MKYMRDLMRFLMKHLSSTNIRLLLATAPLSAINGFRVRFEYNPRFMFHSFISRYRIWVYQNRPDWTRWIQYFCFNLCIQVILERVLHFDDDVFIKIRKTLHIICSVCSMPYMRKKTIFLIKITPRTRLHQTT